MTQQAPSEPRADTRLFQAVHNALRLVTTRLVDASEKLEPSVFRPIIGPRWDFYDSVLHHHHHNEDEGAFPALLAVRPDVQPLVEKLEEDHRRLIPAMDSVTDAVRAFEKQPDSAHQATVRDALVSLRDLFFPHLDVEDAQIIPAVGESIPPKEWRKLDEEALKTIPKSHLPMAVGGLDEVIRGLPEDERPPPPPLPIRLMLAVSWRRKWNQSVKAMLGS